MRAEVSHGRRPLRLDRAAGKSGTTSRKAAGKPRFGSRVEPEDDESTFRVVARMDSDALKTNFQAIVEQVPGQAILPMVKADGYGHGAAWVARELMHFPSIYGLGVATFDEAIEL